MSSWPSSAVEGMAAAASFGFFLFPEQAASVNAALQATTQIRDFFAGAANMASPFLYAMTRGWAIRFAGTF